MKIIDQLKEPNNADVYIDKLLSLRSIDGNFLIEIPETELDFWHHWGYGNEYASRYILAFWIPALSGKTAYKGYNDEIMKNKKVGWYNLEPTGIGLTTITNLTPKTILIFLSLRKKIIC